jgi:hypothetical protein
MKGQTAIEYLMTYGWAILIILIVAGVLAYYGIFAPAGFLAPTARGFGQIQVLQPWSVAAIGGNIQMNLQNRVGGDVTITNASVVVGSGTAIDYSATGVLVSSGSSSVVTFTTTGWTDQTVGAQYTATVTINYLYGTPAALFSSTGTISGTYS